LLLFEELVWRVELLMSLCTIVPTYITPIITADATRQQSERNSTLISQKKRKIERHVYTHTSYTHTSMCAHIHWKHSYRRWEYEDMLHEKLYSQKQNGKIYIYIYIYTYVCTYVYTYIYVSMYVYVKELTYPPSAWPVIEKKKDDFR